MPTSGLDESLSGLIVGQVVWQVTVSADLNGQGIRQTVHC